MDHDEATGATGVRGATGGRGRLRRVVGAATVAIGAVAGVGATLGTAGAARPARRAHHARARGLSASTLRRLQAQVAKAEAPPSFRSPGPAVKDVASLRGKKVMIIPGTTHIPTCVQIADAAAQLATAVGMVPTVFPASNGPQSWNQGIEDAIHQRYAAVLLECALDPAEVAPAIAQAQKAGVRVTAYGPTPAENAATQLSAADADPYVKDEEVSVAQALVQSKGKPFDALVIESEDSPSDPLQLQGLTSELRRYCPGCTYSKVNVDIADWARSFASTVTSALLRHPKVRTVFAFYSGELPYLLEAVTAAHRSSRIKSYGTFGGGNPDLRLQARGIGKHVIMGDIFGDPTWTGYELVYQTALVLEHQRPMPLNSFYTPNRLATPQSAEGIVTTGGFGTAFVNGYRKRFGLAPLHGAALVKASLAE